MKLLSVIAAAVALADPASPPWSERLAFWSWAEFHQIDHRLAAIDDALAVMPAPALINSCVRIGLKTGYTTSEDIRWIEVSFDPPTFADTVALLPPLAKGAQAVVAGYGFPIRFKVEVFGPDDSLTQLFDHTSEDFPNPQCYPVLSRFEPQRVKRVRFTATEPWTADGPEVLSLAEFMVLSGNLNVALNATVSSSSTRNAPRAWTRNNLIDMVTPLGLPQAPQAGSLPGFHSAVATEATEQKWLTLELPEAVALDEIRLIPVRRPEVPLWFDYGFPPLYQVECATQPDFSDAVLLAEVTDRLNSPPGMNPVCLPANQTVARYIRLTANQLWYRRNDYVFALAEFQAYHQGKNIAAQGRFTASDQLTDEDGKRWSLTALNDGATEAGRLIELPDWLRQLEQHQPLASEREALLSQRTALSQRSESQLLYGSVGAALGISLLSLLAVWRQQRQRRLDAAHLRERLARDLHDEIGSNLASITLICSMADQPSATLETLRSDLGDIEKVAAESADSMRDMLRLIQPEPATESQHWLGVLEALAERHLRTHQLTLALPSAPLLFEPDIETRREIYLFCKEVVHNIARHAQATRVTIDLSSLPSGLHLTIADNGIGFDTSQSSSGHGLGNLAARASSLNGTLSYRSVPGSGTTVHLDVPRSNRWPPKNTPSS
jgi:signal transduction histidine kinase